MRTYPYTIDNGHGEELTFTGLTPGRTGGRIEGAGRAEPRAGAPMHVHFLQDEAMRVESGLLGYQVLGQGPTYVGPGQLVVWPAGVPHKWWNAGTTPLRTTGWVEPPDNVEFFLSTLFASTKAQKNARPGLFDAAFLLTRYRREYSLLELPFVVRRIVMPLVYLVGLVLGKYGKFKDAPPARTTRRADSRRPLSGTDTLATPFPRRG